MIRQITIDAILRLINALLLKGYPNIIEVAQILSISQRSLQRLLNEEGVSYSGLVDRCRYQIACESLEHTRDSIQKIASTLGYHDAGSFTRAFRRWSGTTPRDYRKHSCGARRIRQQA
jgi:AraC-like DNA-binding protein